MNFHIDGIQSQESPNVDVFQLSIPPQSSYSLCFTGIINLLSWREERRQKDSVVSGSQVRPAGALVHEVQ